MSGAYNKLKTDLGKVKTYLKEKGIKSDDIVVSSISTNTIFEKNGQGYDTNTVIGYSLYQTVEISSSKVDKITQISRESTELINQDVEFQSQAPEYFYTKIADLKVKMLAEATKDAKTRGIQIAENTDSKLGALKSAKMGVFQITALYSNDAADYGINDTSSLYKEITAVISCSFQVK